MPILVGVYARGIGTATRATSGNLPRRRSFTNRCRNTYTRTMNEEPQRTTDSVKGRITIPKALRESLGIRPSLIAQKREPEDPLLKWRGRGRLPGGGSVDAYLARLR